jgi:hypothetical protein
MRDRGGTKSLYERQGREEDVICETEEGRSRYMRGRGGRKSLYERQGRDEVVI